LVSRIYEHISAHYERYVYLLLTISVLLIFGSIYRREIGLDDAYFAEEVHFFSNLGYVKSELLRGYLGYENQVLDYHRLHVWQGAMVTEIFGWSAYYLKAIPLFYLLVFPLLSYYYFKKFLMENEDKTPFYLFLALLLTNSLLVEHSFIYRPDVIMMFLGFASFFLLRISMLDRKFVPIVFSGMLAGATALMHLNGIIFMCAGAGILLWKRHYGLFVIYSVFSATIALIYIAEMGDIQTIQLFFEQFRSNPALSEKEFSIWGLLFKLITIYRPYLRHPVEISYTLLFMFVLWQQRKIIWKNDELKIIFIYMLQLALLLAIISPGYKTLYLIYHAPFIFLLVSMLYRPFLELNTTKSRWLVALTCLYFITNLGHTFKTFSHRQTEGLAEIHHSIVTEFSMKKGEKILAPAAFVFDEIKNLEIQCFVGYYNKRKNMGFDFSLENVFHEANNYEREFIITDKVSMENLEFDKPEIDSIYYGYQYMGKRDMYYIFKRV